MMRPIILAAILLGVVLATADVARAENAPPASSQPALTAEQIDGLIEQLGARSFKDRERAGQQLWAVGRRALPALRKAADSDDPEISSRAKIIVENISWGVGPNTPPELVATIKEYRAATVERKIEIVRNLVNKGRDGLSAATLIISAEDDPDIRKRIIGPLHDQLVPLVGDLIARDDLATAETVLEAAAAGGNEGRRNMAAFLLDRGTIDAKIAALLEQPNVDRSLLTFLYRAKGDLKKAVEFARGTELLPEMAVEVGDWKAVADWCDEQRRSNQLLDADVGLAVQLGRQLLAHRLAGDVATTRPIVEAICKGALVTGENPSNGGASFYFAKQLLLNDQIDCAVDLLLKGNGEEAAMQLLIDRGEYARALAVADAAWAAASQPDAPAAEPPPGIDDSGLRVGWVRVPPRSRLAPARDKCLRLQVQAGAMLLRVGRTDEGMTRLARVLDAPESQTYRSEVVSALAGSPASAPADALFIRLLTSAGDLVEQTALVRTRYNRRSQTAAVWWVVLSQREQPAPVKDRVATLRRAMAGTLDAKELASLAEEAATMPLPAHDARDRAAIYGEADRFLGIVNGLIACKSPEVDTYFDRWMKADTSVRPIAHRGRYLLDQRRWIEGAELYRRAAEMEPSSALHFRAIRGVALIQAGRVEEGEAMVAASQRVTLANDAALEGIRDVVESAGLRRLATTQAERMLRLSDPLGYYRATLPMELATWPEFGGKDPARAIQLIELSRWSMTPSHTSPSQLAGYLRLSCQVHQAMARLAAAKGDWDRCRAEVRFCQSVLPIDPDITIDAVAMLESAGRKDEADAIFTAAWDSVAAIAKSFDSSLLQNNRAWLAARCRRNLDEALKLSESAVAGDPDSASSLDTLAEVCFQRGDRARAIELMRKCLTMDDPRGAYFLRQLARFEKGTPATAPE